jgi:DNA mismatch repair protein MutS
VQECEGQVVFLHQIAAGSADKSYGIHVAKLAGVPEEVLERANEVLADLEAHHVKTRRLGAPVIRRRKQPAQHPTFFADMEPTVEKTSNDSEAESSAPQSPNRQGASA